jgi:hypothetical protein
LAQNGFRVELEIINGPMDGRVFSLVKKSFKLGRDPENEIALPYDRKIRKSSHVVFIGEENGTWHLKNIARRNVLVDGKRILGETSITTGQLIKVGNTLLTVNKLS